MEAHAGDAPHEMRREAVEQRDLVDGVFDDDAGRMELRAHVGFLLDDRDVQAGHGERMRAREPTEARADDDAVGTRNVRLAASTVMTVATRPSRVHRTLIGEARQYRERAGARGRRELSRDQRARNFRRSPSPSSPRQSSVRLDGSGTVTGPGSPPLSSPNCAR